MRTAAAILRAGDLMTAQGR